MKRDLIFLSYSRKDKEIANTLVEGLSANGIPVWIDNVHIEGGLKWDSAIETALEKTQILILLLSKSSVSSENVKDEVSYALEENLEFIPVLIEETNIPYRWRRVQYIDLLYDANKGLQQLIKIIKEKIGPGEPPTRITNIEKNTNKKVNKPAKIVTSKPVKKPIKGTSDASTKKNASENDYQHLLFQAQKLFDENNADKSLSLLTKHAKICKEDKNFQALDTNYGIQMEIYLSKGNWTKFNYIAGLREKLSSKL
jgi:hypothetical protein